MRRIGAVALISGDTNQLALFEALLAATGDVNLSKVNDSLPFCPLSNDVIPPCYRNLDFIPWDSEA